MPLFSKATLLVFRLSSLAFLAITFAVFLPGTSNVLAYVGSVNVRYLAQPELYELIVDYDPLPYWRDISIDSLAMFGADDTNVPSAESAKRLISLDNPNIHVKIYDGSGHALESPRGYGNSIIRTDALDEVSKLIHGTDLLLRYPGGTGEVGSQCGGHHDNAHRKRD